MEGGFLFWAMLIIMAICGLFVSYAKSKTCNLCSGSGRNEVKVIRGDGSTTFSFDICPRCKGKGYLD